MTVNNLVDSIDVQIKGTQAKRESDNPKRKVDIADLKYYQARGGVLYFVVFESDFKDEVFYRLLLPFDIKRILRDHSEQKTVKLRFHVFPNDRDAVLRLVTKAVRERAAQQPSATFGYCSLDEYRANGFSFPECEFTVDLGANEGVDSLGPYEGGVYVYGKDERGLKFPIDKIENLKSVAFGAICTVSSGTISFETILYKGEDASAGVFYKFDGFKLYIESRVAHLHEEGSLSVRLRSLRLMRELRKEKSLKVNGYEIARFADSDEPELVDGLDARIGFLERIDAIVRQMKIKVDFDVDELSEQALRDIPVVYESLVHRRPLYLPGGAAGMYTLKMPGFILKFLLYDKGNDNYLLMDALEVDLSLVTPSFMVSGATPAVPVPPLLIQANEELLDLGNVDSDVFRKTCESIPVDETSALLVNNKMLDLITAADNDAVCAEELLKCAEILTECLEPFTDSEVTAINKMQIKARLAGLDNEDEEALALLIANSDSMQVKACAAILRDDVIQANVFIGMLPLDKADELRAWPVFRLLGR